MTKKISVPRGTKDILPSEIALWQEVENKARKILETYGYKEIRTPVFEETGLFKRSLGQTSDVVNKQLLEFTSEKKEGFSLRPEETASIVRSYIENSIYKKESLTKLYYMGPMFRGERPQKGRLRQFHQVGVEVLGPETLNPYIDAEVMALSVNILKSLGIKEFQLRINTLGDTEDRENFSMILRKKLKSKLSDLSEYSQQRFERNVFRILDSKEKQDQAIIEDLGIGHSYLSKESQNYYDEVKKALDALEVSYQEVPNLVRGLDYYTHTIFEITDPSLGSQDALGAGGRYNDLVSQLGGPQIDAIGFALGIERLLLAMPKDRIQKAKSIVVYLVALDQKSFARAFQLLNILRHKGVGCDINYNIASLKSQMRSANKTGAHYCMIVGEEEEKKNVVAVKDMETGEQREIKFEEVNKLAEDLMDRKA